MDRMLYVAMSGARQALVAQAQTTQNLANASTTGFRADLADFRSQPVFGPGLPSRVYAMAERPAIDFRAGSLLETGRELDMAIKGEGFIAVQAPDGSVAYTRDGRFDVTDTGMLVTSGGLPVLGDGGPILLPPFEKLDIGTDGTITVRPQGEAPNSVSDVGRIRLVKPSLQELIKGEDGLFHLASGKPAPPDASVTLLSGVLESSNVNAVESMVRMIELQRSFELQVKAMQIAEENDSSQATILRLG